MMMKKTTLLLFFLVSINIFSQFRYHVSTTNVLDLSASNCYLSNPASVISSIGNLKIVDGSEITLSDSTGILDLTIRPSYYDVSAGHCRWVEGSSRGKTYSLGGYRIDINPNIDSYYENKPSYGTLYFEKVNTIQFNELDCNGVTLNATSSVTNSNIIEWQYFIDGTLTTMINSQNAKSIFVDFNSFQINLASYINRTIQFRYKLNGNVFSPFKSYTILNCSPELVGNPQPISPTCSNNINTIDNNNGSFTVTFERELDAATNERMNLQVYRQINGAYDGYSSKVITKTDFSGRSYTWTPRDLPAGTYKVLWQTKKGGSAFDTNPDKYDQSNPFTLTAPPVLSVTGTKTDVLCVGGNDGSITAIPSGGTPPYQYAINGGNLQSATLFENLTKGDYTITVQDNKGCQTTSSVITINERFPDKPRVIPLIIKNPTLIDGNNGSISFSVSGGSGNYTNYTWIKDGNPFTPSATSTNTNLKDLFEGTYTIIVTDSNGCVSDAEEFILIDPLPIEITIRMTPDTVDCSYTQVNLIASAIEGYLEPDGEYSYLWNDGSTNATLANVGIGDYEVTVTDDGGNSQKKQFKVQGPNPIIVTSSGKKELSCRDGSDAGIQLDIQGGTGDYVIIWENLLDPDFSAFGKILENAGFGSYIYRVTDEKGCFVTNSSQPIEFINPPLFTIDLGEDPFFCEGQIVTISAKIQDPLATYNWTSSTGFTSTEPVIKVDQEGKYTATVISGKGCIAEDTIMVTENIKEIKAEFLYASQVFTNEKMVIIDVTYPIPNQIEWILPDGAQIIQQDQDLVELSFETPGTYEITLISKLGDCQDTYTQNIVVLQGEELGNPNENTQTLSITNIRQFSVYPNPSNGQFSVKVELKEQKEISIKIFNLADNVLLAKEKHTGKKEYEIPFSINVAAGVYAIVLETPYGNAIRKVVVK